MRILNVRQAAGVSMVSKPIPRRAIAKTSSRGGSPVCQPVPKITISGCLAVRPCFLPKARRISRKTSRKILLFKYLVPEDQDVFRDGLVSDPDGTGFDLAHGKGGILLARKIHWNPGNY